MSKTRPDGLQRVAPNAGQCTGQITGQSSGLSAGLTTTGPIAGKNAVMPERTLKYVAIRNWLAGRISRGEFARGEQLPSEHEIMAQFSVSRVTARQAFDELRRMGVIEARRGKGYFVSSLRASASLERLQSFGEMMAPLGIETHSDVLELSEIPASRDVSEALGLPEGEIVTQLVRARIAGGTVVSIDSSCYPLAIGRKLMLLDLAHKDVFILMEQRLDIELGYADVTLDVAPAPPGHARFLGLGEGQEVLRLRRKTHENTGQPLAFERIYARLDALTFHVRVARW